MITIDVNGVSVRLSEKLRDGYRFDEPHQTTSVSDGVTLWSFHGVRADGSEIPIHVDYGLSEHDLIVYIDGEQIPVRLETDRDRHVAELQRQTATARPQVTVVRAPMPGLLKEILVEPGQRVSAGTPLCILEAMKMENELRSPGRFVIDAIHGGAGMPVEKGAVIIELGTIDEAESV